MRAPVWEVLEGDCREVLRSLDAGSVHTCVTSPPYFGLRDYGHDGQIGLEPTPDEFVAALVAVFREVRRVLRDDGTVWLNLGDSYCSTDKWGGGVGGNNGKHTATGDGEIPSWAVRRRIEPMPGVKPKDLIGVPWMVAFALRADGWYLRSDIIWSKPNPMPESVTDRPTKAHEYVFLLSKGPRYFYDADAIREDATGHAHRLDQGFSPKMEALREQIGISGSSTLATDVTGRNKRSVWTVATQPYAGAHFATFPPRLIEPCILAGAPERACGECGAPWVRVVENHGPDKVNGHDRHVPGGQNVQNGLRNVQMGAHWHREPLGFEPSCSHADGSAAGVVLDPFAGAGTTGMVALRHNRSFVGIELNPGYAAMARDRIATAVRLGFRSPVAVAPIDGQPALFDV